MTVTYVGNCPHCLAEEIGMTLAGATNIPMYRPTAIFQCNRCHLVVSVQMHTGRTSVDWLSQASGEIRKVARENAADVVRVYPEPLSTTAPEHISPVVLRAFEQGADNAKRKNMDAAAAMYRKALDVATRELDPTLASKNLASRIDALHKAGRLTNDLKQWAHVIRLDGNSGAHDEEEMSEAEIAQIASFTELFLTYAFTLPMRVMLRKEAAEAQN